MTDISSEKPTDNGESAELNDPRHQDQTETPTTPQPPANSLGRSTSPGRKPLFRT